MKNLLVYLILIFTIQPVVGQTISEEKKSEIFKRIPELISEHFIIEELGRKTSNDFNNYVAQGKYDGINDLDELLKNVTTDLQELSGDLHLYLTKNESGQNANNQSGPRRVRQRPGQGNNSMNRMFDRFRNEEGNLISHKLHDGILSIKVNAFAPLSLMQENLDAAIDASVDAKAIIIDLRGCPGGVPESVSYLSGAFLAKETLLSTHTMKDTLITRYSVEMEIGAMNAEKPLYILVDNRTFSAGEAFTFWLQELGRAKVAGIQTRGGGRTTQIHPINDLVGISIPNSIAKSSKGNQFQGIGIKPDFSITEETDALAKTIEHIEKTYFQ